MTMASPACSCDDCKRHEYRNNGLLVSSVQPARPAGVGWARKVLQVPDHEVLPLYVHDETTANENDDGACQWMSKSKGAAIKKKGKVRAAHISDIVGVDRGVAVIGKEAWDMMQEDKDVEATTSMQTERVPVPASSGGGDADAWWFPPYLRALRNLLRQAGGRRREWPRGQVRAGCGRAAQGSACCLPGDENEEQIFYVGGHHDGGSKPRGVLDMRQNVRADSRAYRHPRADE